VLSSVHVLKKLLSGISKVVYRFGGVLQREKLFSAKA